MPRKRMRRSDSWFVSFQTPASRSGFICCRELLELSSVRRSLFLTNTALFDAIRQQLAEHV